MESAVSGLLETFRTLPEAQKHEVVSQILRWAREADYYPLSDDDLVGAAAEVFEVYDRDE